jgi:UDP-N-acetylglucosamine--N-acetylmuramyl-(pentapeptide) pyrophosphoryl-undecaprenol N-acetylglucosamine transferase
MTTIMITAGGTGGHVFPALAVARALRTDNIEVVWLGTREGIEARLVPAAGFAIDYLRIRSLRGGGLLRWLLLPLRLNVAMLQALAILRRRRPAAVLAMGGFASGPGGLMASLLNIPLVVHEQNAVAGLTNRWLAKLADVVLAGFPGAFGRRAGVEAVGNPVRSEILALPAPAARLAGRGGRLRLLIVGGSQGARAFNEIVPQAVQGMSQRGHAEIWHQTGSRDETAVGARYCELGVEARVNAFIDDMAAAYAWADVVLCRAGAMTVAELAAAGVASILVPLPHAADDHQSANARFLADRGAALLLPQGELVPERLAGLLAGLAGDRNRIEGMAVAARAGAISNATATVAQHCREAAHA